MSFHVISTDNHIVEPRELFVTRMPKQYRDRAPRVLRGADGGDGWSWDGSPPKRTFGLEAVAGRSVQLSGYKWEDIIPGNYDGAAHLADMRSDGIDASVLFPTVALDVYTNPDDAFSLAVLQTYNDWLLEDFVAPDPKQLIGLPALPVNHGMEVCVAELERCVAKGAKAFFIPAFPTINYIDAHYDPLWAAAAEAGTPLCLHRTFGGVDPMGGFQFNVPGLNVAGTVARFFSGVYPLTNMIYTGVFVRHPKLLVVDAEVNFGWVPFWKQTMDQMFEKQKGWSNLPIDVLPSTFLGKNVFVTVLDDYVGFNQVQFDPQLADIAMFSLDYPHSVCLWPNSAGHIEKLTKNISEDAKQKILAGNAVRVFGLN
jgi:predicted TIM-barrel fold metal-dependent hydrolase